MTPPLFISSLAKWGSFEERSTLDREEIAANYRLTKRMAELARDKPFILSADGILLHVSIYAPPFPEKP